MSTATALVTGGSRGFGLALSAALTHQGFTVLTDARGADALAGAAGSTPGLITVPGDVRRPGHRAALADAVAATGRLDLLVNNASTLGPSPLPPLMALAPERLAELLDTNVVAPLALLQAMAPVLSRDAVVVNVSSDAAVEPYPGWGGYGASKAALDQASRVLAVERPQLRVYAFDPGDMRTRMHQAAFPREDISDRPLPEAVAVPALLRLLHDRPPSGRYRAGDLVAAVPA